MAYTGIRFRGSSSYGWGGSPGEPPTKPKPVSPIPNPYAHRYPGATMTPEYKNYAGAWAQNMIKNVIKALTPQRQAPSAMRMVNPQTAAAFQASRAYKPPAQVNWDMYRRQSNYLAGYAQQQQAAQAGSRSRTGAETADYLQTKYGITGQQGTTFRRVPLPLLRAGAYYPETDDIFGYEYLGNSPYQYYPENQGLTYTPQQAPPPSGGGGYGGYSYPGYGGGGGSYQAGSSWYNQLVNWNIGKER